MQSVFGSDVINYYRHYILFGKNENRSITTMGKCASHGIPVYSVGAYKVGTTGAAATAKPISSPSNSAAAAAGPSSSKSSHHHHSSGSGNSGGQQSGGNTGSLSYNKEGTTHTLSWSDLSGNGQEAKAAIANGQEYSEPYVIMEGNTLVKAGNIPSAEMVIDGTVTSIKAGAFSNSTITSLTLKGNVTDVEENAFQNATIGTLVIEGTRVASSGVSNVFKDATINTLKPSNPDFDYSDTFVGVGTIKKLELTSDWTAVKEHQFRGLVMQELSLPATVTQLGRSSFEGCAKLTKVEILGNVTGIPIYAFAYCKKLDTLVLPASLTRIEKCAFSCKQDEKMSLSHVSFGGTHAQWNAVVIDESAFDTNDYDKTRNSLIKTARVTCSDYTPPVIEEGGGGFVDADGRSYSWSELKANNAAGSTSLPAVDVSGTTLCEVKNFGSGGTLTIDQSIETVGVGSDTGAIANKYAGGSITVVIPKTVKKIAYKAFYMANSSSSPEVTVQFADRSNGDGSYAGLEIGPYAFASNKKLQPNADGNKFVLPKGVTKIEQHAFDNLSYNTTLITSVTIPNTVVELEGYIFYFAKNIGEINFEANSKIETLYEQTFRTNKRIENLSFPDHLKTIGSVIFRSDSTKVTNLYIPATVETIAANAFVDSFDESPITNIYFGGSAETWESISSGCTVTATNVYVNASGIGDTHESYSPAAAVALMMMNYEPEIMLLSMENEEESPEALEAGLPEKSEAKPEAELTEDEKLEKGNSETENSETENSKTEHSKTENSKTENSEAAEGDPE